MRVRENLPRNVVGISNEQLGFVKVKPTTDAIFCAKTAARNIQRWTVRLHCVFIDLEKTYDRVPRVELYWCKEVLQTGEWHVPSMRNCSEVCCRNKRTLCSGNWPPPRIRFQPFPVVIMMNSLTENIRKEAPGQRMFADDVVVCARKKCVMELKPPQLWEALGKRGHRIQISGKPLALVT